MQIGSMHQNVGYMEYFGSMQYRLLDSKFGTHEHLPMYGPVTLEEHNEIERSRVREEKRKEKRRKLEQYKKDFIEPYEQWDIPAIKNSINMYDYETLMKELYPYLKIRHDHYDFGIKNYCRGEKRFEYIEKLEECKQIMKLLEQKNPFALNTVEENPNTDFIRDIIFGHNKNKAKNVDKIHIYANLDLL